MLAQAHRGTWIGPFSLKEYDDWAALNAQFFGDGSGSASGINVTPELGFTYSAYFDAVNQGSADVAKLPLNLHKSLKNGGSEVYTDSKLHRLLKNRPNPDMSSMVMRRTMMVHALTLKGAFAEIVRDGVGRPAAIWPIHPDRVTIEEDKSGALVFDVLKVSGSTVRLPAHNVLHIHGMGGDGYAAYPVVEMARQAIGLALAAERFGASFFGHGATFGGILEGAPSDPEERKALRAAIDADHLGAERAHKFLMISQGMKYTKLAVDPQNAQMTELRDQQVRAVAGFLNFPVYKLRLVQPGAMSYASVEQNALEYLKGFLLDWITLWEQELNYKLIPLLEQGLQFFKHNVDAFLRGDIKSRQEALEIMKRNGVISANQWLALEDMNPQPGTQGDLYLVQEQNIPTDRINELLDSKITKNETKPAAPAPPDSGSRELVAELTARAERAEALVAELRELVAEAQRNVATLYGSSQATAEQLRAAEELAAVRMGQLGVLGEAARHLAAERDRAIEAQRQTEADARQLAEAKARAEAIAAAADTMAVTAERDRVSAHEARQSAQALLADALAARESIEAAVASSQADRATWEAERERARADEQTARTLLADTTAALAAAEARAAEADAARRATEAEVERLTATVDAYRTQSAETQSSMVHAIERIETAEAAATAARAESERLAEERLAAAEARAAEADAARRATEAEVERLTATVDAYRTQSAETQSSMVHAIERIETAEAAATAARAESERLAEERLAAAEARAVTEAALLAQQQAERERMTAVIGAHRALFVEVIGRMVRRECQQARAKQATQPKLRAWLSGYPTLNEARNLDDLVPVVRVHLAWRGKAEDPATVAAALVAEHQAAFEALIRQALESDPDDYHAVLDKLLTRWEADRPALIADRILAEEIRHVRA